MWKRVLLGFLPLLVLLILPFALREKPVVPPQSDAIRETLVVLTPHAESIRYEFTRAFQRDYFQRYGVEIDLDFRSPGGTSDIVRYINDRYEAAFRQYYLELDASHVWDDAIAAAFRNARLNLATPPGGKLSREAEARALFLASDVSIGIDLFWGGGTYDHANQASKGYAVDGKLQELHPDWFNEAIIPDSWSGEVIYDAKNGGFYGVCLATFGICYNPDRVAELSVNHPPRSWRDLGDGAYFNTLSIADPSKSGSINKCFEVMLQQCMAEAVAAGNARNASEAESLKQGWQDGFSLLKRIVGNAATITDSAGKVTRDVSCGTAAAGMAIDFYAFSEADFAERAQSSFSTKPRIVYVAPERGSSVSADPVQLLRGAPNLRAARAFMEFLLSEPGQCLWNYRAGVPGGPEKTNLRRPPVRRDLYTEKHRKNLCDPDYNPYTATNDFEYHGAWTGPYFSLIRVLIKAIALDAELELRDAWRAILEAGGPEAVPEAMHYFNALPFEYDEAAVMSGKLYPSEDFPMSEVLKLKRQWTERSIDNYRKAAAIAREQTASRQENIR